MKLSVTSEDDMKQLGERIGQLLVGGECIELIGDVGAGKTTLTKGVARGLGVVETVQSPTFTINRSYDGRNDIRLSHYDFYRLSDPGIMADELTESLSEHKTTIIIEWGDIIANILPADHLRVELVSPTESDRTITMQATGPRSERIIKELS